MTNSADIKKAIERDLFCEHMQEFLNVLADPYIRANLQHALDLYKKGEQLPPPKVFVKDPANLCIHNVPLSDMCDRCAESYGEARIMKGEYV